MSDTEKRSELQASAVEDKVDPQEGARPASPAIQVTVESRFPSLEYDLSTRKLSIAVSMFIIISINGIIPAIVYYIVQYGTSAPRSLVIALVEVSTTFTLLHWPYRLWLLKKNKKERSPRGGNTFTLDAFQWHFTWGVLQVTAFCIIAGIKESMRWYMFSFVTTAGVTAISFIITWTMARRQVRVPFQFSSAPAGSVCRPGVYHLMEDITACEGAGGREYRDRLNSRWETSFLFREMIMQITLVSGISLLIQTGIQVAILFATPEKVFVGVSTAILWTWMGLNLWWGVQYAELRIKHEKEKWEINSGAFEV